MNSPWAGSFAELWDWFLYTLEWGNVQEFLTWIVAGVALLFAKKAADAGAKAAKTAVSTDQTQQRQLEIFLQERREAQAQELAVWGEPDNPNGIVYKVSNSSGQPVYDLRVWHLEDGHITAAAGSKVVPPGSFILGANLDEESLPQPFSLLFDMSVSYLFRDVRGQKWHRGPDGFLNSIDEYPETPGLAWVVLAPGDS